MVLISTEVVCKGYFYSSVTVNQIRKELGRRLDIPLWIIGLLHKSKILDRGFNGSRQRLWGYITDGMCELTLVETDKPPRSRPLNDQMASDVSMHSSVTSSSESDVSVSSSSRPPSESNWE